MDEGSPSASRSNGPPSGFWRALTARLWSPEASWFVLALGLLGTYEAWRVTVVQAQERARERFVPRVERIAQSITNRIQAYDQVLKGAAGLYAASVSVERHEWRTYVATVRIDKHYPGIRGLGMIQFVPGSAREEFLEETRNDFSPDYPLRAFQLHPEGVRSNYMVVKFVEPIRRNNNQKAFGYDIGSEALRRATAERARDENDAMLTPRITLVQSTNGESGVLLLRPVYSNGVPHRTLEQRRAAIVGWVYAAFQVSDLMTNLLGGFASDVDFEIFDGPESQRESLLFDYDGVLDTGQTAPRGVLRTNVSLDIAGRKWLVHFQTLPQFHRSEAWNKPVFMAAAGFCISALLFGITRAVSSTRSRARRMAAEITHKLRLQDEAMAASASGITILDATKPNLPVVYVNPAVERMTGYTAREVQGMESAMVICPERDQAGIEALRDAVKHGRQALSVLRCRRRDGTQFWNEVNLAPIKDARGVVTHFVAVSTDITEQREAEEALRQVTNRLTLATRAASLGVWDWDIVQDKLVWDDAMYKIYGLSPEQFSGAYETWASSVHPEDKQRATAELQQALRGEKEFHTEFRIVWPDQSVHYIEANGVVLRDTTGKPVKMLGINADVTQRKRAAQELEQARLAAEAASRAKSEFVANMSHEIRTPLNAVMGMTTLALETPLSAEQRDYLNSARQSADELLALVNDVLDFSKIEAGKLELNIQPFLLRSLIEQSVRSFRLRAQEKRIRLGVRVEVEVPDRLMGDAQKLRQVLVNLVDNAVKFTEQGEVQVEVRRLPQGDAAPPGPPVELEFVVADTGIGIAREKQEAIFDSFTQADGSITRSFGGTGLGLAISRRLVSLMGGSIGVESEPARGSRFHFTLRMPEAPPEAPPQQVTVARPGAPARVLLSPPLRILVAEDNRVNAELLSAILRKLGHSVTVSGNGHEALSSIAEGTFDLVLMDLQMPGLDGFEAAARIRDQERGTGRRTPIIAVTAHALEGMRDECKAAGMDEYISKPIERAELIAAIERCLPGAGALAVSEPETASGERLVQQLNGDVAAARKLIDLFLETTPRLVHELRSALTTRDAERLRRAAHTLKGSVTQLGDSEARAAALHLEDRARAGEFEAVPASLAELEAQVARLTGHLRTLLVKLAES